MHKFLLCPPRVCFLWGSQSLCQIPRLGNLLWAPELLATVRELLWYNFSAVCGSPAGGSMVGLMETSSKRTYTTCYIFQDSCCQSPCPRSCLLLTHASTGNPQTVTGRSGSVLVEVTASFPGFAQGLICALQASLVGMRFEFTAFQIGSSVPSF